MNAERLLQHYDQIADAPDAIARMRRFILDLAVRGKLVPQNGGDEPANVLHAHLSKRFVDRSSGGGRGRRSEIAAGLVDQPPYPPPSGWLWVRMGDLGETNIGLTYSPNDISEGGIPVLRSNNVKDGKIVLDDLVRVASKPKCSVMVTQGDMLICARNGSRALVGKAAIVDTLQEPMAFGAFMAIFRSPINSYLHLFLASPVFRQVIDEVNTNTINQITQANLKSTLVPLPPLAEQHRIVAKVDELMRLCDRLETAREKRETTRDRLAAASLARLDAPNPETFQTDARFALDALPTLTTRPDQIKRLRQTILNLAVRGKLVPQDRSDEPASELLKRIAKERARLVKAGEIRKSQQLQAIGTDDLPFDLPNGWAWTRLGEVIHLVSGQHLQPPEYSDDPNVGLPYITGPSDFGSDGLEISRFALVRKAVAKKGQLLLTVKGSGVGKSTLCDIPEVAISRQLMALTAIEWNDRFLLLITHRLAEKLQAEARSLIPGISREDVDEFVVPLPPLAEQHRIVAKVDALIALCDRLETSLTATAATRRRLLDALLAEALTPEAVRELEAAQ